MASPTDHIAGILETDRDGAREFASRVRHHLDYMVKYTRIVQALETLPPNQHKPLAVSNFIRAQDENDGPTPNDEVVEAMHAQLEVALGEPPEMSTVRRAVRRIGLEPSEEDWTGLLDDLAILSKLAQALEMPLADTWHYADDTRDGHVWPLTYADILAAVEALGEAPKTTLGVLNSLALHLISRELNIDRQQAKALPSEIAQTIGRDIDHDDLLRALQALGSQATEDDVWDYYLEEALPVLELAELLETTAAEARQQLEAIQSTAGPYEISGAEVAHAISETGTAALDPEEIVTHILSNRLADALGLAGDAIRLFNDDFQNRTGRSIDYGQLLAAVPNFQLPSGEIDHVIFLRAWYVAAATNRSLTSALWFINTVRATLDARAGARLNFPQLEQAIEALPGQSLTVDAVVSQIRQQELQATLRVDAGTLDTLAEEIETAIGAPVTNEQIAQVVRKLEDVTPQQVLEQFKLTHRPVRRIARALAVSPREARDALREIAAGLQRAVSEEEVLRVLEDVPEEHYAVEDVLFLLKLTDLADELQIDAQRVREQFVAIQEEIPEADRRLIVEALRVRATDTRSVRETAALVSLALELKSEVAGAVRFLDAVQQQADKTVSAVACIRALKALPANTKHEGAVATFVSLIKGLKPNVYDDAQISQLASDILRDKVRTTRFRRLWASTPRERGLTLQDGAHLLSMADWPQITLNLVSPREEEDEQWITCAHLQQLLSRRSHRHNPQRIVTQAKKVQRDCWQQITSPERAYDVPSRGRAEILAGDRLSSLLGLHSLRFVREGVSAPGLFVQFKFSEPVRVGVLRIAGNGATEGFHRLADDDWFSELIAAIALTHYRDLVLPTRTYRYIPRSNANSRQRRVLYSSDGHSNQSRSLPRARQSRRKKRIYKLEDWYESQERARHTVTGHRRWVRPGFVADPVKQRQARSAGVELPTGYTWVVEHERGNPQHLGRIQLDDRYDLLRHTVFRPPVRASRELESLLA